jgi:hypothetical protein
VLEAEVMAEDAAGLVEGPTTPPRVKKENLNSLRTSIKERQ